MNSVWIFMAENVTVVLLLSMVVLGMLLFFTAGKMRHIGDAIVVTLIYGCIAFFLFMVFVFMTQLKVKYVLT